MSDCLIFVDLFVMSVYVVLYFFFKFCVGIICIYSFGIVYVLSVMRLYSVKMCVVIVLMKVLCSIVWVYGIGSVYSMFMFCDDVFELMWCV